MPHTVCLLQHMEAQLVKFDFMLQEAGLELQRGALIVAACAHTQACSLLATSVLDSHLRCMVLLHVRAR